MDKNQLQNFVTLAQTLNFSATAKRAFISQPALTKQITRLEEEIGVKLFVRNKHGVSLTFAGNEFYYHATEILRHMEEAELHMGDISKGLVGSLRISCVYGMENIIARSISAFKEYASDVSVTVFMGTGTQQIKAVNEKQCDVFFSFSSLLDSFQHLEMLPLPDDRMEIYIHKKYAEEIEKKGFSYLETLPNLIESSTEGPFLTPQILSVLTALGIKPDRFIYHPSNATILIAIQAGAGYSILPSQMNFSLVPEEIVRIPVDVPESIIHRALGWPKDVSSLVTDQFVKQVKKYLAENY